MKKKLIIVPTDFSKVGHTALNHAVKIAQTTGAQILLVHIVPDKDLLDEAKEKLAIMKKMAKDDYGFELDTAARIGSVYEDVSDLVEEQDASLVVLGTHGIRGLQFITGSRTLRIVTGGKVPYIVVQEKQIGPNGYDDIIVPLDLNKETKQKLSLVAGMAKYFDSRVHIIIPGETDEFLKNQVIRNMTFAENFFDEKRIRHTSHISESKSDDFDQAVIEYAHQKNADLISIMNIPGSSLAHLIGGNYVQNVITNNYHIPVLMLNPVETTRADIFGAYSGVG